MNNPSEKTIKWLETFIFFYLLSLPTILTANNILLPPAYSDIDYIIHPNLPPNHNHSLRYERYYNIENNVLPLSEADEDVYQPREVATSHPFYNLYQIEKYAFQKRRWRFEYAKANVTSITGNYDAGQVWVDAKSKSLDPSRLYHPSALERRTYVYWLKIEYAFPFKSQQLHGESAVGLRLLTCHRFREWEFNGSFFQNRLIGDMLLLSSRGIDFSAPHGKGFALDFLATFSFPRNWQGLIAVEGLLGEVNFDKLRRLDAMVDTGSFAEDPEGFLHNLPALYGKETYISLKRRAEPQTLIGLSRKQKNNWSIGMMFSERIDEESWHLFALRMFRRNRLFLYDVQLPLGTATLGYISNGFTLLLGLTHPKPKDSFALTIQCQIGIR